MENPYCIVNLYYYEVNGKPLDCEKCIMADSCEPYQHAKIFVKGE